MASIATRVDRDRQVSIINQSLHSAIRSKIVIETKDFCKGCKIVQSQVVNLITWPALNQSKAVYHITWPFEHFVRLLRMTQANKLPLFIIVAKHHYYLFFKESFDRSLFPVWSATARWQSPVTPLAVRQVIFDNNDKVPPQLSENCLHYLTILQMACRWSVIEGPWDSC